MQCAAEPHMLARGPRPGMRGWPRSHEQVNTCRALPHPQHSHQGHCRCPGLPAPASSPQEPHPPPRPPTRRQNEAGDRVPRCGVPGRRLRPGGWLNWASDGGSQLSRGLPMADSHSHCALYVTPPGGPLRPISHFCRMARLRPGGQQQGVWVGGGRRVGAATATADRAATRSVMMPRARPSDGGCSKA